MPFNEGPYAYTTDQKWTVALLKLLDDVNAPDYLFTKILTWAQKAKADGYLFCPLGSLSCHRNVELLYATTHNAQVLHQTTVSVPIPHGPPTDVITFDFASKL